MSNSKAKSNSYCSVPQCKSWHKKNPKLTFHMFPPKDDQQRVLFGGQFVNKRKVWLEQLRMPKDPTPYTKVCGLHFRPDDFFRETLDLAPKRRRLKKNAFPTCNLPDNEGGVSKHKNTTKCIIKNEVGMEEDIDRTSLACVRIREDRIPTIFPEVSSQKVARSEPLNKKQKFEKVLLFPDDPLNLDVKPLLPIETVKLESDMDIIKRELELTKRELSEEKKKSARLAEEKSILTKKIVKLEYTVEKLKQGHHNDSNDTKKTSETCKPHYYVLL